MLVKDLRQAQSILPSINLKVDASRLEDFFERAQDWVADCILGDDLIEQLESGSDGSGAEDQDAALRKLTCRVICEMAYLAAVDELNLQLTEAGFVVLNNQNMSPASMQRTDALKQSLQSLVNGDCDALVNHLLKFSLEHSDDGHDIYKDWRGIEQYAYLTSAFMPTMAIMRQNTSETQTQTWKGFYELIPKMVNALNTTVASYVSADEIETLLELYRDRLLDDNQRKVLRWIRFSVMADISGNHDNACHFAITARNYMIQYESSFREFVNSDRYHLPAPFDFGDGTVANAL